MFLFCLVNIHTSVKNSQKSLSLTTLLLYASDIANLPYINKLSWLLPLKSIEISSYVDNDFAEYSKFAEYSTMSCIVLLCNVMLNESGL